VSRSCARSMCLIAEIHQANGKPVSSPELQAMEPLDTDSPALPSVAALPLNANGGVGAGTKIENLYLPPGQEAVPHAEGNKPLSWNRMDWREKRTGEVKKALSTSVESLYAPPKPRMSLSSPLPRSVPMPSVNLNINKKLRDFVTYGSEHDAAIWRLAVPAYATALFEPLAALMDSMLASQIGTMQLSGVGLASPLYLYVSSLFCFLSIATTTAVAKGVAAHDSGSARRKVVNSTWVAVSLGVVASIALCAAAPQLVGLAAGNGAAAAAVPHAISYLRARAVGLPAMLSIFVLAGASRGNQDLRTPLYASLGGSAVNAALSAIAIFALGLGAWSVGASTTVSLYATAGMLMYMMGKREKTINLQEMIKPPSSMRAVFDVLRPSVPLVVRKVLENLSFAMILAFAASLSAAEFASHEVARSAWALASTAWWPLSAVVLTLCAKLHADNRSYAAKRVTHRSLRIGALIGTVCAAALTVCSQFVSRLLGLDGGALGAAASQVLRIASLSFPLAALVDVTDAFSMSKEDFGFQAVAMGIACAAVFGALEVLKRQNLGAGALWCVTSAFFAVRAVLNTVRLLVSRERTAAAAGAASSR